MVGLPVVHGILGLWICLLFRVSLDLCGCCVLVVPGVVWLPTSWVGESGNSVTFGLGCVRGFCLLVGLLG